ncbi:MAG: GtrA family protein [Thermoplasmatota archaeon]
MRDPAGHMDLSGASAASGPALPEAAPTQTSELPDLAPRNHGPRIGTRFLRFALVGASGVVVNALLLLLLVERFHSPVLLASLLSIEVSTLSNWALNRAWTWKDRAGGWASLGRYHAVAVGGMAIQWTILGFAVHALGVHYLLGSLMGVAAATAWNFLGNDRLAFALQDGPTSRLRRATWYATALLVQLAIAAVMTHPWDSFVFQKSVTDFLVHGITPYTVAMESPSYIFPGPSLPLISQWYAYPPLPLLLMSGTYAPVAFGAVTSPWMARILLKLPFILGTLGFAWAARRLIATAPGSDPDVAVRQGDRAERWILLNPLFLLVAGVWGQFEALLLMLVLLSVLALRSERWMLGGLAFGGALLLKIFPVYLGPLLLVHLVRKSGWRAAFLYFGAAGILFTALTLPFYLAEPHGTLQQIFLMHAERPPARFAPIAALFVGSEWVLPAGSPGSDAMASVFGRLSFAVTAIVIAALAAAYARRPATERTLLLFLALSMTGGLLATKVFNEQYTLLPLGLLAAARFHPEAPSGRAWPVLSKVLTAGTWAMLATALLDNFHVFGYLPPDIAAGVLGADPPVATRRVAAALGLPVSYFLYILAFATRCALVVPFVLALKLLKEPVLEGLRSIEHSVERVPSLLRGAVPGRAIVLAGVLATLIALPLSAAISPALLGNGAHESRTAEVPDRAVLAELRTDWYNPTNDPTLVSGTWAGVELVPIDGHFNMNARKASSDLATLRAAGVDAVLVHLNPDYPSGASAVRTVAESLAMPYALALDVGPGTASVPLEEDTARELRSAMMGPGADWWGGRWHLTADGRDLIVLSGVDRVMPGYTPAEHRFVLESYAARHGLDDADASLTAAAASPPTAPAAFAGTDGVSALWRDAYAEAATAWWALAIDGAPHEAVFMTDAPLPSAFASRWLGDRSADQPPALEGSAAATARWATLDGELAPDAMRPAWLKALWAEPTAVVVPWNDFSAQRAVEPTVQHGDAMLRETASWAYAFHHPSLPAPPPVSESGRTLNEILPPPAANSADGEVTAGQPAVAADAPPT